MNKFFVVERNTRYFIRRETLLAKQLYTLKDAEGYLADSIDDLVCGDDAEALQPILDELRNKYKFCEFSILQFKVEQTLRLTRTQ